MSGGWNSDHPPRTASSNNFGLLEPSHIRIEVLQFCVARQLEVVADQQASRLGLESPRVLCQVIIEIVPAQFPICEQNTVAQLQIPRKLVRSARNGFHPYPCQVF